ncbi:hypothetical protein N9N79_00965 [Bacteroidia bacterium]|nr:hypothetical protein [Bacteroidia bacterium]
MIKTQKTINIFCIVCLSLLSKQTYAADTAVLRIGFLLPIYKDPNSSQSQKAIGQAALDYYSGVKIALSRLQTLGLHVRVFTWDLNLKNDSTLIEITKSKAFQTLDVLVGPLDQKRTNIIASNLQNTDFLWISPLKQLNLPKTVNSLNFFADDNHRIRGLIGDLRTKYHNHDWYLVTPRKQNERVTVWLNELKKAGINFKTIKYSNNRIYPRPTQKKEVLLVNAGTNNFSKLSQYRVISTKYDSYIVGDLEWYQNMMSIAEVDEKRIIYPQINMIYGLDSITESFTKEFVDSSLAEPSKFAFIGYDQLNYIGLNFLALGHDFYHHFPKGEYTGLINNIQITKEADNQWVNTGMRLNQLEFIEVPK